MFRTFHCRQNVALNILVGEFHCLQFMSQRLVNIASHLKMPDQVRRAKNHLN